MKVLKTLLNRRPKAGDLVEVAVGFSSYLNEGIVSSVHDTYCWVDQFYSSGRFKSSFTASFSYCKFIYIN